MIPILGGQRSHKTFLQVMDEQFALLLQLVQEGNSIVDVVHGTEIFSISVRVQRQLPFSGVLLVFNTFNERMPLFFGARRLSSKQTKMV